MESILRDFHDRLLAMRRIERILCTYEFESLYEFSSESEKKEFERLIGVLDIDGLKDHLFRVGSRSRDPAILSTRELRERARTLGIRNYATKMKATLVAEINIAERDTGHAKRDEGTSLGVGSQGTIPEQDAERRQRDGRLPSLEKGETVLGQS